MTVRETAAGIGSLATSATTVRGVVEVARLPLLPIHAHPFILLAVETDTNPKRKRGTQVIPSLTLRVSVKCLIFDREQYRLEQSRCHGLCAFHSKIM